MLYFLMWAYIITISGGDNCLFISLTINVCYQIDNIIITSGHACWESS